MKLSPTQFDKLLVMVPALVGMKLLPKQGYHPVADAIGPSLLKAIASKLDVQVNTLVFDIVDNIEANTPLDAVIIAQLEDF